VTRQTCRKLKSSILRMSRALSSFGAIRAAKLFMVSFPRRRESTSRARAAVTGRTRDI